MAHVDTGKKGSVNLDLNIVPFIDVMSCLTAFLLVTAVWIQTADLQNQAKTHGGKEGPKQARLQVLIEPDALDVAFVPEEDTAAVEHRPVRKDDWEGLAATLRAFGSADARMHVEIAANSTREHPIAYQTLIAAMDTTMKAGFPDVGVVDPAWLAR
jgi:biopolymer transport protein ExbD